MNDLRDISSMGRFIQGTYSPKDTSFKDASSKGGNVKENILGNISVVVEMTLHPVPEFIDPRFRENKPKTLVFSH